MTEVLKIKSEHQDVILGDLEREKEDFRAYIATLLERWIDCFSGEKDERGIEMKGIYEAYCNNK